MLNGAWVSECSYYKTVVMIRGCAVNHERVYLGPWALCFLPEYIIRSWSEEAFSFSWCMEVYMSRTPICHTYLTEWWTTWLMTAAEIHTWLMIAAEIHTIQTLPHTAISSLNHHVSKSENLLHFPVPLSYTRSAARSYIGIKPWILKSYYVHYYTISRGKAILQSRNLSWQTLYSNSIYTCRAL